MQVEVRNMAGEATGTMDLDDRVFGIEPNRAVLHQAVVAHRANMRQGTASTRTRAVVAGGGKKPWRQKGTGRARSGSTRAPHWRGGGIVFGPHPRSYHQSLPRKMRRLALRSALSDKMASDGIIVVDGFDVEGGRTKNLMTILSALGTQGSVIIVLPEQNAAVRLASGNLRGVHVALPNGLSVLAVLSASAVVFSRAAVQPVTQLLLSGTGEPDVAA